MEQKEIAFKIMALSVISSKSQSPDSRALLFRARRKQIDPIVSKLFFSQTLNEFLKCTVGRIFEHHPGN